MGSPGHLQAGNVLLVYLIKCGEAIAVRGISPVLPILLLLAGGYWKYGDGFRRADQRLGSEHPPEADPQPDGQDRR